MLDRSSNLFTVATSTQSPRTAAVAGRALAICMALAASGAVYAAPAQRIQRATLPEAVSVPVDTVTAPRAAIDRNADSAQLHVLVELSEPSGVQAYVGVVPQRVGKPSASQAVAATQAVNSQLARTRVQQATFLAAVSKANIPFAEIYRVQRVKNAVAMIIPQSQLAALRKLPGVKSVRPIIPSKPNSLTSVPFVLAPEVWQGLPAAQADGTGIKIGIIDTGIDYQHANFGGTGALAGYQDNDHVSNVGINSGDVLFPTAKVAGGYDLAGDAYDANGVYGPAIPTPDANPMDCNGHGSHVAGTAGGLGVTTAGATYSGTYTAPIDPPDMRIFPGMAPGASMYAFRVFGCGGSTDLVVEAIDRAIDPNQDGDFSDHMDVINMSLGSSFIGPTTLDAEASQAASEVGVMVVASSGNSGDTYLVTGSPAAATRSLSVAASWDGGEQALTVNTSASTAPTSASYFGVPAAFGPPYPSTPLTGTVVVATPLNACAALTNGSAITGNIALIQRGGCNFDAKSQAAQNAGAIAVIVFDNTLEVPFSMSGTLPLTIPSAMISLADGTVLKTQAGATTVTASVPVTSGGDLMTSFSSRGPTNNSPIGSKPDITAPGLNVVSTQTGITCVTGAGCITPTANGYDVDNQSLTISGTSMAAPHVAGLMALLRQLHPALSVEELKALAMNGALHDLTTNVGGSGLRFGGGRVGAGRIDADISANLGTTAYNADGTGAVSITFPSEIFGTTTVTKTVHVVNHAATSVTYALGFDTVVDNPGIEFSLPGGNSLTLAAGASANVAVTMTGIADQVTHTHDATIYATQSNQLRYFMTEETGYLTFASAGDTKLRVPLYVAPYPAGAMSGGPYLDTGGNASGNAVITLSGTPVCTNGASGGDCQVFTTEDEVGLVSPFELQAANPRDTSMPASLNIRHVGVSSGGGYLNFGIQNWGAGSVPGAPGNDTEITLLDTNGNATYTLYPYIVHTAAGDATNAYFIGIYNWSNSTANAYNYANYAPPNDLDTRLFQNDSFITGGSYANLGLTASSTVQYIVDTYDEYNTLIEELGPFTYNIGAPGMDFGGGLLFSDMPTAELSVTYNTANLAANGSLGALLIHHHNKVGSTGEVITLEGGGPVLSSIASRKIHGGAGAFDLLLSADSTNPTLEPRTGPASTLVFTFDKPVNGGTATVDLGTATVGSVTYSGNSVLVNLTGVADAQYVSVSVSGVTTTDGGTGGTGAVTLGYLAGDVTQNHLVSVADMGFIQSMLAQPVTTANYLMDVNASGTISTGDLGITNANLTHSLQLPN